MKKISAAAIIGSFIIYQAGVMAQNTGINANGGTPDVSAMLDVDVSSLGATAKKGLLIPRVALTSSTDGSTIPTPATSLMIYCTGTGGLTPAGYYYNSGTSGSPVWVQMLNGGSPGTAWMLAGNTNTNPGTDFLGTTDAKDLQIKTTGVQRMYIRSGGVVNIVGDCGIGTTLAPSGRLQVDQGTGTSFGVNIQCTGNSAGTGTALNILKSGAPTGAFTSYGIQSSVTTTTNSTNVSGYFSATGGASANYAIIVPSGGGNVGIGLTAPVEQLQITNNFRLPATTGSTAGVIYSGGNRFIHNYGSNNFFAGVNAGNFTMTGNWNTAMGQQALTSNTSGVFNTATGYQALYLNADGGYNTASGWGALGANTSGGTNVAFGYSAASANTSGGVNTAIGSQSLLANTTGSYNVAVGWQSYLLGTYSNSVNVAANGGLYIGASNQVIIGNGSHSSIGGQVGWSTLSDARVKNNVQENVPGLSFINELRPVTFHYDLKKEAEIGGGAGRDTAQWEGKYDIEKMQFSGFLAQEVDAAANRIGYSFSGVDKHGKLWALRYAEFVVPLVKSVQELNVKTEAQQKENEAQQRTIELLLQRIEALEKAKH